MQVRRLSPFRLPSFAMAETFVCKLNNVTDLCFGVNSTCLPAPPEGGPETCICSHGYQADTSFMHMRDCALPPNFFIIYLGCQALVLVLDVLVLGRHIRLSRSSLVSSGTAQKLIYPGILQQFIQTLVALSMFLQNGMFEAGAVLYVLRNCVLCILVHSLLELFLKPLIVAMSRIRDDGVNMLARGLYWLKVISISLLVICGGLLAGFARSDTPIYNRVGFTCLFTFATLMFLHGLLVELTMQSMVKQLRNVLASIQTNRESEERQTSNRKDSNLAGTELTVQSTMPPPAIVKTNSHSPLKSSLSSRAPSFVKDSYQTTKHLLSRVLNVRATFLVICIVIVCLPPFAWVYGVYHTFPYSWVLVVLIDFVALSCIPPVIIWILLHR